METIAVYSESRLKTYGFKTMTGLSLLSWPVDARQMADCGLMLQELGETGGRFHMVAMSRGEHGVLRVHLLLEAGQDAAIQDRLGELYGRPDDADAPLHSASPVEMVFFHGPHYGDRYGIADLVLGVLAREAVPILLSACSASSIYLVFPPNAAAHAISVLSEAIEIPRAIGIRRRDPREEAAHDRN